MKVIYHKVLMEGALQGCKVECGFPIPDQNHADVYVNELKSMTSNSPGRDCMTGNKFYVTDIKVIS